MTARLIDEFVPRADFGHEHRVMIQAPVERVEPLVRCVASEAFPDRFPRRDGEQPTLGFGAIPFALTLFLLRGVPGRLVGRHPAPSGLAPGLRRLSGLGFIVLAARPDREFVCGAAGRPWTLAGDLDLVTPESFRNYRVPGRAKLAMSLCAEPIHQEATCLTTSTRVVCWDAPGRRRFRAYWWLIGGFSGLMRREILAWARREATKR